MSPYYQDDAVTIYHGDCREILPSLTERADLVLTDPPFFMPATHYQSRVKWQRSWSDTSVLGAFWATVLEVTMPRLKPTGHLLTFCNGDSYRYAPTCCALTPHLRRLHPVEKPEALLRALIEPTTVPGGSVLDPFAGSGSTLYAAKQAGRKGIGIEGEERYSV